MNQPRSQTNPSQPIRLTLTLSSKKIGIALALIFVSLLMGITPKALASMNAPEAFTSSGTIHFQGELSSSGSPVSGEYNMRFSIFDASSSGTRKWPAAVEYETHSTIAITDGIFSVWLGSQGYPITPGVFAGGGDRYLQIEVCETAGAGCATFDILGRLPIASAAYAQNLTAGSSIEGSSNTLLSLYGSDSSGSVLRVHSSATTGNAAAIYASAAASGGAALSGSNSSGGYGVYGSSNSGYGIYGNSTSGVGIAGESPVAGVAGVATDSAGRGVYGSTTASSGTSYGVYGSAIMGGSGGIGVYGTASFTGTVGIATNGTGGTGVFGQGETYGVQGTTSPYNINGIGVYGSAPVTGTVGVATTSGNAVGVYGEASGTTGGNNTGVYGRSNSNDSGRGVYGYAAATTGSTYGVYGQSDSPDGYGVYSEGNAFVQGTLTTTGAIELQNEGIIFPDGSTQNTADSSALAFPVYSKNDIDWSGPNPSLTIGADGLPIIAYERSSGLSVAHCTNPGCTSATVSTLDSGVTAEYPSIAIGSEGFPVIGYYDAGNGNLKLALCNDIQCSSANIFVIDNNTDVGQYVSLAIDTSGRPIMSYYDAQNGDLKVAYCNFSDCTGTTAVEHKVIDSTNDVGLMTQIRIGIDGLPIISYYHAIASDDGNLKVAHCDDANCTSATITTLEHSPMADTTDNRFISMVIGLDGLPMISYLHGRNWVTDTSPANFPELRLAQCNDLACTGAAISVLDNSGEIMYQATNIAVGMDGRPFITYGIETVNPVQDFVTMIQCSDPQCANYTSTIVSEYYEHAEPASLVIGMDGMPIFASIDNSYTATLQVTHCSNRFCVPYARP